MNSLRKLPLLLALSLPATPLAFAGEGMEKGEFEDWANRPTEKFENGAKAFQDAKAELLKSYVRDDLNEDDLYRAAVEGMLRYADPKLHAYNTLLGPAESNELQTDMKGELIGIGIMIDFDSASGVVSISGVVPSSPSESADLRAGDKVLSIDGRSFKGAQTRDVVYAIRGKEGVSVTLEVLRDAQVLAKVVRRERVKYSAVVRDSLPEGIDLIQIHSFSDLTPGALKEALEASKRGGVRGLVIDLRRCPGGLLERSLESAKLLLPKGATIVRMTHRGGKETAETNDQEPVLSPVPTAVLIDGDTKSSAEFLAAALREGLKAPLLGQKTYGKWTVQTLSELPNHFVMKYTVASFQGPDGKSYDGAGLPPDIEVALSGKELDRADHLHKDVQAELAADVQLRAAYNLLRLEKH